MDSPPFTNRLARETSPYLRQHQHNPVDWFPWGPEALATARKLDRPIFLSIGYSACHWCHVMEHESFENAAIAAILNEHFVSIKVDREERPDLDQIYMTAVQLLTGQGGWPMSVFLTPDLKPFTGGTYFPPDDRFGRPGFRHVLLTISEWWKTRRPDIDATAGQLTEAIQLGARNSERGAGSAPRSDLRDPRFAESLLRNAVRALAQSFDPINGGFGAAPKFPHPMDLRLLLRAWRRFGDDQALHMVRHTLDRMAMGGIYDHLGGGFARYSTDARWLVPHFEKMLYDNALLVPCYLEAFQVTGDPLHEEVETREGKEPVIFSARIVRRGGDSLYQEAAEDTIDWVRREMMGSDPPYFYSTLDADSEGQEGKFYVWTQDEIEAVLGKDDATLFNAIYGVEPEGNWRDPHGHGPERANILHRTKTFAQGARLHGIEENELRTRLANCRHKLFDARNKRVRPGLDDKGLTSWNALMIGALAQASQVQFDEFQSLYAALAAEFILTRMRTADGRLLRTYTRGSEPKLNAYLEDYAFLADALVTLYETRFELCWIVEALDIVRVMIDQFWDESEGGFFYTGRDHEALIARTKDAHDNALPSSNGMAVMAMLRLAKLTGRTDLWDKAARTLELYHGLMASHPQAMGQMLMALDFYLGPVQEIAIVRQPGSSDWQEVVQVLRRRFQPNRVVAMKTAEEDTKAETERRIPGRLVPMMTVGKQPKPETVIALLAGKTALGPVTTYICENFTCQAPLVGVEAAEAALKK